VTIDDQLIARLRQRWEAEVRPNAQPMERAAKAQYEVIQSLRREQQRLVDEADRVQRLIDQLDEEYKKLTTPRPGE